MSNIKSNYTAETLGLFGLQTEFTLCHIPFIVVDDVYGAVALEGSSGTGKTTLIKRIGKLNELATGGKVSVYSADKARYEDFVGCPIPDPSDNTMKIYTMPNSVAQMETILIDEINRATYDSQEKWLSLIATREIDGFKTKCKYIYTAMNPVLSDTNDNYEGVQPLDKALGERMIALISMPQFYNLDTKIRLHIMRDCFKQVEWKPTEELVTEHIYFIKTVREFYENFKTTLLNPLLDYFDGIQADLRKDSRGAISIEARRAQFLVTNALATCAINKFFGAINVETSVLQSLLISFPNRLWEQPIEREALKAAHTKHSSILKSFESGKKSHINHISLERILEDIKEFAKTKPSKEQLSKIIHQNLPNKELDPLNYYNYAVGAVIGLTIQDFSKPENILKEQEFDRFNKIYKEVTASDSYNKFKEVFKTLEKNSSYPPKFTLPEYILNDVDPNAEETFRDIVRLELIGVIGLTIIELSKAEVSTVPEVLAALDTLSAVVYTFRDLILSVKN